MNISLSPKAGSNQGTDSHRALKEARSLICHRAPVAGRTIVLGHGLATVGHCPTEILIQHRNVVHPDIDRRIIAWWSPAIAIPMQKHSRRSWRRWVTGRPGGDGSFGVNASSDHRPCAGRPVSPRSRPCCSSTMTCRLANKPMPVSSKLRPVSVSASEPPPSNYSAR